MQTMGQKAPASVSQIVPLHRKYWPIPAPKRHGMIPNTVTFISASCRVDELSILCPSEGMREVAQIRYDVLPIRIAIILPAQEKKTNTCRSSASLPQPLEPPTSHAGVVHRVFWIVVPEIVLHRA